MGEAKSYIKMTFLLQIKTL